MGCETCDKKDNCPVKDYKQYFKQRIEAVGFRILVNTEYCELFRKSHSNCEGCESEDGCRKLSKTIEIFVMCYVNGIPPEIAAVLTEKAILNG